MSGLLNWWRKVRGKSTEQQQAEADVQTAQDEIAAVRDRIQGEIEKLKHQQLVLRAELQQQVQLGAPRTALANTTKKLKQVERQIAEKEKLHANVARENTQLCDTTTNTRVASAMMQSVEAQQRLQKLDLGGRELDEALDEIEENREDTKDLADRLAHLGGDELDELMEDGMQAEDIVSAMGLRTERRDDILLREVNAQLAQSWRVSGPEYNGNTEYTDSGSRADHYDTASLAYAMQSPPSNATTMPSPLQFPH